MTEQAVTEPSVTGQPTEATKTANTRSGRWGPAGSAARSGRRLIEGLWLIVLVVAAWWLLSAQSTNFFIPPLSEILDVLGRDLANGVILSGAAYSLTNLFMGLLIATVLGIGLGLLLGELAGLRQVVDPVIHFFRSVPQAALVPMIIGVFGMGQGPKMGTIAFACMWPILLNTIDGVLGVEPTIRKFSKVYRIPPLLHFLRVVLPSALPQIVAGVRVALPIGITVMVVSEMFASIEGLGFYILNSSATFKVPETWAGALLVGVIGYIISILFVAAERRLLRWYYVSGAQ